MPTFVIMCAVGLKISFPYTATLSSFPFFSLRCEVGSDSPRQIQEYEQRKGDANIYRQIGSDEDGWSDSSTEVKGRASLRDVDLSILQVPGSSPNR